MKKLLFLAAAVLMLASCTDKKNFAVDPAGYDFSEVFTYGNPFRLGIIGEDFTRLQVYYSSVTKKDATHYAVKGFSKVEDNVQSFEGEFELKSIQKAVFEEETDHTDNHDVYILESHYVFRQADGTFEGNSINEILFKDGKALTDVCYEGADGYDNNGHTGTFTSNIGLRAGQETVANWGAWRIPESDDLDQGVGEFVPSEKYRDNGWASYYNSIFNYDEDEKVLVANAKYEEAREWWNPDAPTITAKGPGNLMDSPMKAYDPDTYFIEATTPDGPTTIIFPSTETPEYGDINFDGYKDLYQLDDKGYCYLYDPQTKDFAGCPSYNDILYKGSLTIFSGEKVLMSSNYFIEKGERFYYLYRFEDGKFVLDGTVLEKDGVYTEYDKDGNEIHKTDNISDLSRVWAVCFAG